MFVSFSIHFAYTAQNLLVPTEINYQQQGFLHPLFLRLVLFPFQYQMKQQVLKIFFHCLPGFSMNINYRVTFNIHKFCYWHLAHLCRRKSNKELSCGPPDCGDTWRNCAVGPAPLQGYGATRGGGKYDRQRFECPVDLS